jgi:hypothetical protein
MLELKMLKRMKEIMPTIMFQGIESSTGLGIPDVFYTRGEISGWIELKELGRIPRHYFKMPWRPGQLAWYHDLRNKYKSHAPYFIVLTLVDHWYILDSKMIKMKEQYTMEEIESFFLCKNRELKNYRNLFKTSLYIND